MKNIKVVETQNKDKFEQEINMLIKDNYSIGSTSCRCGKYCAILLQK